MTRQRHDVLLTAGAEQDIESIHGYIAAFDSPANADHVLDRLMEAYPSLGAKLWDAEGNWSGFVTVLLNGRSVQWLQGLETLVADDDAISLFPPVGGG